MEYFIYIIENDLNGMSYVGRTTNTATRWAMHRSHHRNPKQAVTSAIKEFGIDSFTFRIVDVADSQHEAMCKERLFVHLLESNDPRYGYNNPYIYRTDIAERKVDKWLNRVRG